jgi:quercetin dioxygenase-like cupin family protein
MTNQLARLDIAAEIETMRASARTNGHVAKTLIRFPELRLVLMWLRQGAEIPAHQAEGAITLHVLEGRVRLATADDAGDLVPGQLVALEPSVPHAIAAIEDSAVLLTIAWRGHHPTT